MAFAYCPSYSISVHCNSSCIVEIVVHKVFGDWQAAHARVTKVARNDQIYSSHFSYLSLKDRTIFLAVGSDRILVLGLMPIETPNRKSAISIYVRMIGYWFWVLCQ